MRAQQFRALSASSMSEKEFQAAVVEMAQRMGFLVYHTHDSRRSEPGYPDLHLVHPRAGRSLFRELKSEAGVVSAPQKVWLSALRLAGCDAAVWRPRDLLDRTIEKELRGS